MDNIVLSICIGTYNRYDYLIKLIETLLTIRSDKIEIVVVDNASTDGTFENLKRIKDDRLNVYSNKKNEGAMFNYLRSIDLAHGKYAMLLNDRDSIIVESIPNLLEVLEKEDYAVVYTFDKNHVLKKLYTLYDSFTWQFTHHPTGMIYNKKLMEKNNIKSMDYLNYKDGIYVWSFLGRDIQIYEKTLLYPVKVWTEADIDFKKKNTSNFVTNESELYFSPVSRKKQFFEIYSQLKKMKNEGILSEKEFHKTIYKAYTTFYSKIGVDYSYWRINVTEMIHYNLEIKKLSLRNILENVNNYKRDVNTVLKKKYLIEYLRIVPKDIFVSYLKIIKFILKK